MSAKSFSRGHAVTHDRSKKVWTYDDTGEIVLNPKHDKRPCKRCGHAPTKDGHDHCLGAIKNVTSACCGHGIEGGYVMFDKAATGDDMTALIDRQREIHDADNVDR